ncbi:MAG: flippase, partial [bacterium]|nr:flippase [bacterium]
NLTAAGGGFLLTLILARMISPSLVGSLYTVIAAASVISLFFDLKIEETIVRYSIEFRVKGKESLAKAVCKYGLILDTVISLVFVAVLFFMAPVIGKYFRHIPDFTRMMRLYLPALFFLMVEGSYNGILQSFRKFNYIAYTRILKNILRLAFPVCLIKFGVTGILAGFAAAGAVSFIAGVFLSAREIKANIGGVKSSGFAELPFRSMARFSFHSAVSSTVKSMWTEMDIVILGYFRLPREAGFYKIGKSLALLLPVLVAPIQEILYPVLTKLYQIKDKKQYLHILKKTSMFCFAVVFPAALFMFVKPEFVIKIFYPPEYVASSIAVRILIPGFLMTAIVRWSRPFFLSIGRPQLSTAMNFIAAAALVGFSLIFVPAYGMIASSIVMSAVLTVMNFAWFFIVWFYLEKEFRV